MCGSLPQRAKPPCASLSHPSHASQYNVCVTTWGIREFMARDWDAVRAAKDTYWGDRVARLGAAEGLRIADELRRQARAMDAAWPHAADRRRDLRAHVVLRERLARASSARRT